MTIELASQLHPTQLPVQIIMASRLASRSSPAMLTTEGWWTCLSGQVGGLPLSRGDSKCTCRMAVPLLTQGRMMHITRATKRLAAHASALRQAGWRGGRSSGTACTCFTAPVAQASCIRCVPVGVKFGQCVSGEQAGFSWVRQ